jgi:hypothetical protein
MVLFCIEKFNFSALCDYFSVTLEFIYEIKEEKYRDITASLLSFSGGPYIYKTVSKGS